MTHKEISKAVKKQLKERFPNRRISVRVKHISWYFHLCIQIENLTDEEKEIAYEIANQYKIDKSDPYTDYFDVNYISYIYSF